MITDDFMQSLGASLEEEKVEAFEQSTLSLVLKQLGATPKYIRKLQAELGPAYNFAWFNEQQFISPLLSADRCFSFNFEEIFTKPGKSPVVKMVEADMQILDPEDDSTGMCIIFKCYKLGRLIATNIRLAEYTHIHVAVRDIRLNIVPFSRFFGDRYGQDIIQE